MKKAWGPSFILFEKSIFLSEWNRTRAKQGWLPTWRIFFQTTFTPDGILKFPSWSIHGRTHARTHGPECRARTSSKFLDQLLRRHFNFRPFFPPIRRHNVLTLSERFDLARVLYATHTLTRSASQGSVRKLFGVGVAINFFCIQILNCLRSGFLS